MTNDSKKQKNKKPKFSPYWIYAGIIGIFLILNILGGSGFQDTNPTTPSQFMNYLRDGDIEKVEIVNRREAKVYLTKEAEAKEVHKNLNLLTFYPQQQSFQTISLNLEIYKILKTILRK